MNAVFLTGKDFVERRYRGETLRVEAWTKSCIRVRATRNSDFKAYDWAIEPKDPSLDTETVERDDGIVLKAGALSALISRGRADFAEQAQEATLRFFDSESGRTLLEEKMTLATLPDPGHTIKAVAPDSFRVESRFKADSQERFYGMGHNQNGLLNLKGCALELRQMNTHTVVPVVYSSKGYGFFWNNPAYGRVEFASNGTYWISENTDQLDYFVYAGSSPADAAENYARLTGFPSMMPEWATGLWQCKLRYRNREELLDVAREYKRRGLPMSVIVIDFFHWAVMGDWDFDPACWPDPQGMLRELKGMGIETMVSIWPTVNADSSHFQEMLDRGFLVQAENGLPVFMRFTDTYANVRYLHFVDFTNPSACEYVWQTAKKNYYDRGVRLFWLDECEPEVNPYDTHNMRYYLGNGAKVSSLYPLCEERAFYLGMKDSGEELPINLCRSAWAGSQKYGACVWSGDVFSTFEVLEAQVKNGLNMAMAGIPWWTTDTGGFFGGDVNDPVFCELIVRWFQWSVFCPVLRLHGFRNSSDVKNGGPNELWSFGEDAYGILRTQLLLRERLRPYVLAQMKKAHETGVPPMRPLFFDFPADSVCYEVDDEFLFGPDIVVAPVVHYKQRSRRVYLPAGLWIDARSGMELDGGRWFEATAPLEYIPIYCRKDAQVGEAIREKK